MDEKIELENCETIFIRFLDPKLGYKGKIRPIASFSVSDSFSSRGTDQEWINMDDLVQFWMPIYLPDLNQINVMNEKCM